MQLPSSVTDFGTGPATFLGFVLERLSKSNVMVDDLKAGLDQLTYTLPTDGDSCWE